MPSTFLPALHELIASSVPIRDYTENNEQSRNVVLEECQSGSRRLTGKHKRGKPVSKIEIKDLPENTFVFKADTFPQPQALFNDIREVRKRADYILIAKDSDKQRIVFIEMKATKDSEHGIKAQLRGAACIMDYCNSILKYFWDKSAVVLNYEPRFVSCSHTTGKNCMHPNRNQPLHDTPENLLKLKGHSFTYQQLIKK